MSSINHRKFPVKETVCLTSKVSWKRLQLQRMGSMEPLGRVNSLVKAQLMVKNLQCKWKLVKLKHSEHQGVHRNATQWHGHIQMMFLWSDMSQMCSEEQQNDCNFLCEEGSQFYFVEIALVALQEQIRCEVRSKEIQNKAERKAQGMQSEMTSKFVTGTVWFSEAEIQENWIIQELSFY